MTTMVLLSLLILLPLGGAALLIPLTKYPEAAKNAALAIATVELLLAIIAWSFAGTVPPLGVPPGFFLYQDISWIDDLGIGWTLGMDAISLLLVAMTALLTIIAMLVSWRTVAYRTVLHYIMLLVLESAIVGVFLALDLFLFYIFWEVMLIPMFFLIGIWGHGRNIYSAIKFFIFTLTGSLFMLLAIIGIYFIHGRESGTYTFNLHALLGTSVNPATAMWLYAAFLLSFAVKFPLVPLHTWLPDAHTDASTAGSIDLAGLLLKTGAYGLIRFACPLFPEAARTLTPMLLVMAAAGILYGSWIAFAQQDMKRLVAYSSIGHMGFVALGIAVWTPIALSGSVVLMVSHGITTSALFALVGMLASRTQTREISKYGGLWGKVPLLSSFFLLFAMASAGLPGLNNFIGEFLILVGSFKSAKITVVLAAVGLILSLVYTVRLVQELLFQKERQPLELTDLAPRELVVLSILALGVFVIGIHPGPLLDLLTVPVEILTGGIP
ncbi:MAG: complex I subunit 4 family protein [Desulforhopalus sp.]